MHTSDGRVTECPSATDRATHPSIFERLRLFVNVFLEIVASGQLWSESSAACLIYRSRPNKCRGGGPQCKPTLQGWSGRLAKLAMPVIGGLVCAILSACAVTTVTTAKNQPLPKDPVARADTNVSRSSITALDTTVGNDTPPFIGVALSGGGSRAANFAWGTLRALYEQGFLSDLDSVSSVSGGSLAGALYALNVDGLSEGKEWERIASLLRQDFLSQWMWSLANPALWFSMATSDVERTHVMTGVFERTLFGKATFRDLGPLSHGRPRLFLNATSATSQFGTESFRYTTEEFRGLGSRLDTYPIADAVMASGAFPGVFGSITLNDFNEGEFDFKKRQMVPLRAYERIYDGGPSDNLGIWTLVERARQAFLDSRRRGKPMPGCLIFAVDAYAPNYDGQRKFSDPDTDHSILDLLIKSTAWDSIDALLASNRAKTLQSLGVSYPHRGDDDPDRKLIETFIDYVDLKSGERSFGSQWAPYQRPVFSFPLFGPSLPWTKFTGRLLEETATESANKRDIHAIAHARTVMVEMEAAKAAAPTCMVWHLTFDRLKSLPTFVLEDKKSVVLPLKTREEIDQFEKEPYADSMEWAFPELQERERAEILAISNYRTGLWAMDTTLKTSYRLAGPSRCTPAFLQEGLFSSAHVLVNEDTDARDEVCAWYRSMGIRTRCDAPKASAKSFSSTWGAPVIRTYKREFIPTFACVGPDVQLENIRKSTNVGGVIDQ